MPEENAQHPAAPVTPPDGIPVELIDDLHKANDKLHAAREHVEQAIEALVNSSIERRRASQDLREAEQAEEQADEKIKQELRRT